MMLAHASHEHSSLLDVSIIVKGIIIKTFREKITDG
jgi:hypothetical protein